MLEKRLYHSRWGKVISSVMLAGTMAFSTPAYADVTPARASCERTIPDAVEIGYTGYCTDRFGVIYDADGNKVRNARELHGIRRLEAYSEAKEAAKALYGQLEAEKAREAAQPSSLEEKVGETAAPARGPPPPYLRHLVGREEAGQAPPDFSPSGEYSQENLSPGGSYSSEEKEGNKSNDVFGYILTIGGGGLLATKLILDFATDPCPEGVQVGGFVKECHREFEAEDYVLYTLFGAALVAGIYLLVD